MALHEVTPIVPVKAGTVWTWLALDLIADIFHFENTGNHVLLVKNASAGAVTVSLHRYGTYDGEAVADRTEVVDAGTMQAFAAFPTAQYSAKTGEEGDGPIGHAAFSFSAITDITYQVMTV